MAIDPTKNQGDDPVTDTGWEEDPPDSEVDAELEVLDEDDTQ